MHRLHNTSTVPPTQPAHPAATRPPGLQGTCAGSRRDGACSACCHKQRHRHPGPQGGRPGHGSRSLPRVRVHVPAHAPIPAPADGRRRLSASAATHISAADSNVTCRAASRSGQAWRAECGRRKPTTWLPDLDIRHAQVRCAIRK